MQRRSFLRNAACVGACATLLAPLTRAFADDAQGEHASVTMRLIRLGDAGPAAVGSTQLRVTPIALARDASSLRVRAWFATDGGPQAFDLASFAHGNASQRLRFTVDPQRLIGFEAATGAGFDDCLSVAACSVQGMTDLSLRPGQYRLSLLRDGDDIACVDLDVSSVAA